MFFMLIFMLNLLPLIIFIFLFQCQTFYTMAQNFYATAQVLVSFACIIYIHLKLVL